MTSIKGCAIALLILLSGSSSSQVLPHYLPAACARTFCLSVKAPYEDVYSVITLKENSELIVVTFQDGTAIAASTTKSTCGGDGAFKWKDRSSKLSTVPLCLLGTNKLLQIAVSGVNELGLRRYKLESQICAVQFNFSFALVSRDAKSGSQVCVGNGRGNAL